MKTSRLFSVSVVLPTLSCTNDVNIDHPDYNFPPNSCLDGQGSIVFETRSLADFHSINNTIYADILLTQGAKEDITIEAQ